MSPHGKTTVLTPTRRARLLDAMCGGLTLTQAARFLFVNKSSIHRALNQDEDLRAAVVIARTEGALNKEAITMATTVIDADPAARVAALERCT